jgi:glycosyltransferase involved in cell wall biosynthesis
MHLRGVPAISRAYWVPAQAIGDSFVLVARALEPYFAPSARPRTRVVYNGVELRDRIPKPEARAALARQLAGRGIVLPEGASLVVSVSSPTPFKGLHHLLDALRALVRKGRDVVVLCAGSGSGEPYEAWLQGRVAASGAGDRFVFLGFWDRVQELLSAADVTVVPSVQEETLEMDGERLRVRGTEGLPRAVLESLAAGVPVVASDVAGVREQIDDGRTGYVVPPGDVLALSSALERVLVDGAWRAAAGEAGREVVSRRFTIDGAAKGLAVVLEDLAARPPSAAERFGRLARLGWDIAARGAYSVNT